VFVPDVFRQRAVIVSGSSCSTGRPRPWGSWRLVRSGHLATKTQPRRQRQPATDCHPKPGIALRVGTARSSRLEGNSR